MQNISGPQCKWNSLDSPLLGEKSHEAFWWVHHSVSTVLAVSRVSVSGSYGGEARSVSLPCQCCDGVQVTDVLGIAFIKQTLPWTPVEHTQSGKNLQRNFHKILDKIILEGEAVIWHGGRGRPSSVPYEVVPGVHPGYLYWNMAAFLLSYRHDI